MRRVVSLLVLAVAGVAAMRFVRAAGTDAASDGQRGAPNGATCTAPHPLRDTADRSPPAQGHPEPGIAILSHTRSRDLSLVDLRSGAVSRIASGLRDPHEVAVSPDGRLGVVAEFGDRVGDHRFDGNRLAVLDLRERRLLRVVELGRFRGPHDIVIVPGPPSRIVVTTQTAKAVVEVDPVSGAIIGATPTGALGSHTLAVARDAHAAFVANEADGTVSRLDLASRSLLGRSDVGPPPIEGIAVTPDGAVLLVGTRSAGEVRILEAATGERLATLRGFRSPDRIEMSPDGRLALVSDFVCRQLVVVDVGRRARLGTVAGIGGPVLARMLPDSRTALVALLDEGEVRLVDVASGRELARHPVRSGIESVAWGPLPD